MSDRPDILRRILERKAEEIAERNKQRPLAEIVERLDSASPVRGFIASIESRLDRREAAVIAEIKKASPSRGILRDPFEPTVIARAYEQAGAACLSVLTDRDFFQGHDDYLRATRAAVGLPVLRKDFMIDPYQICEAREMGADCILLIVAALGDGQLSELFGLSREFGMDALIEVHDGEELQRALHLPARLIGINNRNLRTFDTSLRTTLDLLPDIDQDRIVVTESGILGPDDVRLMRDQGVETFLVGEAFMKAADPGVALNSLFGELSVDN